MKIAIVGGGIFGVTAAIKLAEAGYAPDLFEKNNDILTAASYVNQYRLHRGYHYPRSPETIDSCKRTAPKFEKEYSEAVLKNAEHYYCIAKEGSFTSADEFLSMCKKHGLKFTIVEPNFVNKDKIDLCVKVDEASIDPVKLKKICWQRLKEQNVNVVLNTEVTEKNLKPYDVVILCTYANFNAPLTETLEAKRTYQLELCEKPVIKLPSSFKNKSMVVMDGPFMCFDPFGRSGFFLTGHVVHAIHKTVIGETLTIDEKFKPLLNNGVIKDPPITNFELFKESGQEFIPGFQHAEHIGSMFTIRTVLPNIDDTDERPTIVEIVNDRIITVYSGKISNCVEAAKEIVEIVKSKSS